MKYLCVFLASSLLLSCSHPRWKPSEIPTGKSKSLAVETLGSPERSWRSNGKDYWYYNPSLEDPSQRVILVFENGQLIEKVRPGIDLEGASDFDELEAELKKLKPNEAQKFETLSE